MIKRRENPQSTKIQNKLATTTDVVMMLGTTLGVTLFRIRAETSATQMINTMKTIDLQNK